jgi:hypothetical protein
LKGGEKKMRKLFVVVCVVTGMLLMTGAAWAVGYHAVYQQVGNSWQAISGPTAPNHHAEMYSGSPDIGNQYQFRSDPRWEVGGQTPYAPLATDPLVKRIINEVRYYPWLIVSLNETDLIWDIFKPGKYMSKGPLVSLKANCPVAAFVGSYASSSGNGRVAWWITGSPKLQVPHSFDPTTGKITWVDYGVPPHSDNTDAIENKPRTASLIKDDLSPGTPPDVIDMYWWGYTANSLTGISELEISSEELAKIPGPDSADWYSPAELEDPAAVELIEDSVPLHKGIYLISFEKLEVEDCDSEGKYYAEFTLFFAPADP